MEDFIVVNDKNSGGNYCSVHVLFTSEIRLFCKNEMVPSQLYIHCEVCHL